jgi:hypothetical protein
MAQTQAVYYRERMGKRTGRRVHRGTRQLPEAEIERAERRFADFKARMDAERRVPPRAAGQDAPAERRYRS